MSSSAFDTYAASYDTHFTATPIGKLQRQKVYAVLFPLLDKTQDVLEINCGTGEDAINIAPSVNSVLATDISEKMIEVGEIKNLQLKIKNLEFRAVDLLDLAKTLSSPYNLLFSNFGGLNCIDPLSLKKFSRDIAPFISTKGKLVLVVMGKKCIWENFFFSWQKDKRKGRRNTNNGVETKIGESTLNTYYYSPADLEKHFEKEFRVVKTKPVGLFIPPSYLNPYFEKKKVILGFLNILENLFGGLSFAADYADHYVMILKKRN